MECVQCGYNNKDWSISCSNCGKDFRVSNENEVQTEINEEIENPIDTSTSLYPYPGSIKYLQNLMADKKEKCKQIWTLYTGIMMILIIVFSDNFSQNYKKIIVSGFYLCIICFIITYIINMITIKNYYNIPMSKNKKNQHKCIFCGHDKLEKIYILSTPLCSNHCAECENFLFYKWQYKKPENNN